VDNTANFNTLMSTESSVDTLHILLKKAKELAANDLEYLRLQKKATDDKIAQIKGQSEEEIKANNRAELLRKAQELRQQEWEDRQISDYQESLRRDEDVRKRQEKLQQLEDERMERETTAAEEAKKSSLLTAVPDNIKNAKPQEEKVDDKKKDGLFSRLNEGYKQFTDTFKNAKKQQEDGEQKNLGEKTNRVSFNPEGIKILKTLLIPLYTGLNVGALDGKLKELIERQKEIIVNTKPKNGLLDMLGKLLLVGGVAATLVGLFWPKIKDWLEKKMGVNLDFLEKFRGIVEGIGKFFTMGGLKITFGGAFKVIGGVIKSFGELIETGLTVAFKSIFSGGAAVGEAAGGIAKAGTGFKGLLPKIAAGLFKGLGATVLKGIPVIGGLISLGFAISRFKSGDWVGGVIDLVGGIANFLELIPGLGLIPMAISLGATALNTFLDFKAGGEKNSQSKKLGAIGGLFLGFWNLLKKIPVIGTVLTFAEGTGQFFTSLITGNMSGVKDGLSKMAEMPFVGLTVWPLLALLDSAKTDSQGKINGFDLSSFWKNFKMRVGKTILSWFSWLPKSWQKGIADLMGVPFEGGNEKEGDEGAGTSQAEKKLASDKAKLADFNLAHGEKGGDAKERAELENAVKQGQGQVDGAKTSGQLEDEKYKKLKVEYESQKTEFEKYDKESGNNAPEERMDKQEAMLKSKKALIDYEKNKKSTLTAIPQNAPNNNQSYQPAPVEPQVSTTPENGITKMNSALNDNLMKTFSMLSDRLATSVGDTSQGPTIINNTTQSAPSHDNTKEYLFKPVRDVNYDKRMSWWGNSMNYRATLP
jgi:hypothetical protein